MRFSGYAKPYKISGDYGERDPPVPMPNTEVKPFSADGTWLETTWESRTLPDSMKKRTHPIRGGSFFYGKRNPPAMLVEVKALAMQKKPPMLQWKRPGSRPK